MQMQSQVPVLKDVVLVGAGHAHVAVLRDFGMKPMAGVRLTLITRQVDTPYSGMLPGLIAGHYTFDEAHIDTGPLTRFARARLHQGEVTGLDLTGKRVICRDRPPVPFDVLSIDIGSMPSACEIPGATEHAIPVKPIDSFLARFEAARQRVLKAGGRAHVAVVGAGAGGVELMLALQHRLTREIATAGHPGGELKFSLFSATEEILPAFPAAMQQRFVRLLEDRGIAVRTGCRIDAVEPDAVHVEGREWVPADEVFWTTEAEPARWLAETGLALDEKGFIRVTAALQSVSHPKVFAAGDVAMIEGYRLPRSGVYAVREGPPLARNLRRMLSGKPLIRYKPQRDALYLMSTGGRRAIGTRNGITFGGRWVWRLKDWIDRRFMARFNELPESASPEPLPDIVVAGEESLRKLKAAPMRCGGCGAKVGAKMLARALGQIDPLRRNDIVIGLDQADDAAVIDNGGTRLSVLTVDYFRAPVDDPYLFGKIAANHALGDLYAMGAEPQAALAIASLPFGPEAKVEADLAAMMAGANAVLRAAECALVGGHTSEAAELSLGFAVTGLAPRSEGALQKGGLRPGDVLILTKPLGTGTLLAAHIGGKAKARWVMGAVDQMVLSSRDASAILRSHGATAASDVTGFGLVGHLIEMTSAGGVHATLHLRRVPLLEGVRETIGQGLFSSLHPQNLRLADSICNREEAATDPLYPVLFDPQTAGGLLAAVPATRAATCVAALREAGYPDAAIIGAVEEGTGGHEPIRIVLGDPR